MNPKNLHILCVQILVHIILSQGVMYEWLRLIKFYVKYLIDNFAF